MAKVKILGRAVMVVSDYSYETLKDVEKYAPEALTLKDKDDNPLFKVTTAPDTAGGISEYGAAFAKPPKEGGAIVEFKVDAEDVKEKVANTYGGALMKVNKIEAGLKNVIKQMAKDKAAVMASIEEIEEVESDSDSDNE